MADENAFYGTWEIVECVSLAGTVESTGIEGTVFALDEGGDVSWKVCPDAEPMPFFSCETYEVTLGDPAVMKFFGTYAGHVIEFKVEISDDLMLLTYERCCMLQCQKISTYDPKDEVPFSFLSALREGYFTDRSIKSNASKEFHCHDTVLQLAFVDVNWKKCPTPLCGQPDDVIATVLHYAYGECLPKGLSEDTTRSCIKALDKVKGFKSFIELCNTFLKNTALKHQIESLLDDMHTCCDRIIDLFSGKVSMAATSSDGVAAGGSSTLSDESLVNNPTKLCYVFKQSLREASVASAKVLILCDLFSRRKSELSREERHNIIKYAKSRLPVFLTQLERFCEVCIQHYSGLTNKQKQDLSAYLVPEIERAMETMSTVTVEVKSALEHVIQMSSEEKSEKQDKHKKGQVAEVLGKSLRTALHVREMLKLRSFHEKMTNNFVSFMQQKDQFSQMTQEEKCRSVSKTMEQLIDENVKLPIYLRKIRDLRDALDEKINWREWKYLFKMGTSKVAWVLSKLQCHKGTVMPLIKKICDMIHRDQFTQCLTMLGLTQPSLTTTANGCTADGNSQTAASASATAFSTQVTTKYAQLSAIESLCEPPYARDSELAKKALDLLHCAENTDIVFEILTVQESGDVVIDHTHGDPVTETGQEVDVHVLPAHRVIIASRCDWFRRALSSGMRESIDKKIIVHDTNPAIFKLFIEFLYCGQLDMDSLATEQLSDLLSLSDRYEMDSLKSQCEYSLKHHVDDESVLFLLSLADQLNAKNLRCCTLTYIIEHPSIMNSEVFEDLPQPLQREVENVVSWQSLEPGSRGHTLSTTSSEMDLALGIRDGMSQLHMNGSSSSSNEDLDFVEDSGRLEACVAELRGVVGEDYPRDELVQVALAADCDTNRALNYIFSAPGSV